MNEIEKEILEKVQRLDDSVTELRLIRKGMTECQDDDYITEMAGVNPTYNKSAKVPIYVFVPQGNEGPIPHMHVYHDKSLSKKKCSFIRLDKAEYSPHHDIVPLPSKLRDSFLQVMSTTWPKYQVEDKDGNQKPATGYEAAVDFWIDTNGVADSITFQQDEETGIWMMPPYDELFKFERK